MPLKPLPDNVKMSYHTYADRTTVIFTQQTPDDECDIADVEFWPSDPPTVWQMWMSKDWSEEDLIELAHAYLLDKGLTVADWTNLKPRTLTLDGFQQECARIGGSYEGQERRENLMEKTLGLVCEAAEASDALKKHLFHGHPVNLAHLREELGDALFYLAEVARAHGIPLSEIAQGNVNKLARRYPKGYSHKASQERVDREQEA